MAFEHIPLCEPNLKGNEKRYTGEAVDSNWLSGGHFLDRFEQQLAEFTGAKYVVGVSSGATALHVALLLAGVGPGDLVIMPNLTFVATANAIKYVHADPVLIDADRQTWVLDLELLREFLAEQTAMQGGQCMHQATGRRVKAIVPVHLLGNMCDMNALVSIAEEYGLALVEDAACSLGSSQNGRHSGTLGLMGTLSFNSNKIITTGGGGAILTNEEHLAKRARFLITQAKSPGTEYLHREVGYNYRLVNPLAAIGAAQMEQLPAFIASKKNTAEFYVGHLEPGTFEVQKITPTTDSNYWHSAFLLEDSRPAIAFLAAQGIESRPLWLPINRLDAFRNDIYVKGRDHSHELSRRGIMLPCSTSITEAQLARVCQTLNSYHRHTFQTSPA